MDAVEETIVEQPDHPLQWTQEPSGAWVGLAGSTEVGLVGTAQGGGCEWRLRVPAGPTIVSGGRSIDVETAKRAADEAWTIWTQAHGLVPNPERPTVVEAVEPSSIDDARSFAIETYRRQSRSVVERGYSDAYDAALISTVLDAYRRHGDGGVRIEDTDAVFHEAFVAEKRAVDEARAKWGPLIGPEPDDRTDLELSDDEGSSS